MAKILITETVHPIGPELLTAAGHTVVYADRDMDIIRREIVDADAVFVRIIELPGSLLSTANTSRSSPSTASATTTLTLTTAKRRASP